MNKKNIIACIIIVLLIAMTAALVYFLFFKKDIKTNSSNTANSESYAQSISEIETVAKEENIKDEDFSSNESYAVELTETYKITKGGVYILTGEIKDGYIYVETEDSVKLILKNVKITNSTGPAIYVSNADKVYIELAEGTENYLEDGENYSSYEEDVNSVIYSKDDLVLTGKGKLTIVGNYNDGIVSKDDLKIEDGTYIITSKDDAIRGKDSVSIKNGTFEITAGGDGIVTTNDTDDTKGYIYISNGTFTIKAESDGIVATKDITIDDGNFNITSGGGQSKATTTKMQDNFRNFKVNTETITTSTDETSAKGIKAENNIIINGGTFKFDTKDDSIHSNNYIGIKDGTFEISSGDDAIHADSKLIIENGTINITKSYEGLEAECITIENGKIDIIASDDGINVAGGAGSSNMFMVRGNMETINSSNVTTLLTINGGNIYVNSAGDGLDSNGSIVINGGTIVVNGPTDNGNTALDYEYECTVNGGTLVASGSSGMAQGISTKSTQGFINANVNVSQGDIITIKDSSGNEIFTYTSKKQYSNIIVSTSSIKNGETYTIYSNVKTGKEEKNGIYKIGGFTSGNELSSVEAGKNTSYGFSGGMQGGQMGGNGGNFENNMNQGLQEPDFPQDNQQQMNRNNKMKAGNGNMQNVQ